MSRADFYVKTHQRNLPTFLELVRRIMTGVLKLVEIRVDGTKPGAKQIIIFVHEEEE